MLVFAMFAGAFYFERKAHVNKILSEANYFGFFFVCFGFCTNTSICQLKQFNLSERDTTHFIRAWRSYMHGFLLLETNGSFALNEDVDTSFNYGLDILKYRLENKSVE